MRTLSSLFHSLTWREGLTAAADILIVYYFIYRTLLLIKGTRAAQMLIGLVLVGAGFFAAKLLELTTLTWLLDNEVYARRCVAEALVHVYNTVWREEASPVASPRQKGELAESASSCPMCTSSPFTTWIAFSGSSTATWMCMPKINSRRATYWSWSIRFR